MFIFVDSRRNPSINDIDSSGGGGTQVMCRSLTHYCVLVTCKAQTEHLSKAKLDQLYGQQASGLPVEFFTPKQIDSLFTDEALLGDEVKQLMVEWNDISYKNFRESLTGSADQEMPFTGYSTASPWTFQNNSLETHELSFLFDRVVAEMNIERKGMLLLSFVGNPFVDTIRKEIRF